MIRPNRHNWTIVFVVAAVCLIVLFFKNICSPSYDHDAEGPFYPRRYTGSEIMAERWPNPDFNDPEFLADFSRYMGFDFHND